MTDEEYINNISSVSTEELFNSLEYYGYDPYYAELWRATIEELKKRVEERPHGKWISHIDNLYPEDSTEECPFCHEEQGEIRMNNKEAVERLNLVQETVYCIRNKFNQNTESDKLIRNCMALLQNAIDGEYHDMEKVDVSELKRPQGEWVEGYHDYFETLDCSQCGYVRDDRHKTYNFCPNCGADMRKEVRNETELLGLPKH